MSFPKFALRTLIALGAALTGASVASATPTMPLGMASMAPAPYVDFCERQPHDCGADAAAVAAGVQRARAERAELAGALPKTEVSLSPAAPAVAPADDVRLPLSAGNWARLNDVNARVNRAIRPATDRASYGVDDRWATPLEDGAKAGDCEDYVLEKIRALVAAGVPRAALDIALVTTGWGENHAVLVVASRDGDFVLDNLSPVVRRWDETGYRFNVRQVGGEAFAWMRVKQAAGVGLAVASTASVAR